VLGELTLVGGLVWAQVTPERVDRIEARVFTVETQIAVVMAQQDIIIKLNYACVTALALLLLERAIGLRKNGK